MGRMSPRGDYMAGDAGRQARGILTDVCLCADLDMDRQQMVLRRLDGLRDVLLDLGTGKIIRMRPRLVTLRCCT